MLIQESFVPSYPYAFAHSIFFACVSLILGNKVLPITQFTVYLLYNS